jgi:polyribonucleotide nucleotidyltransferase
LIWPKTLRKSRSTSSPPDYSDLYAKVKAAGEDQMRAAFAIRDKQDAPGSIAAARDAILAALSEEHQIDPNLGSALQEA